jgi:hypothetical protein
MANKFLMGAICASLLSVVTFAMQPAFALSFQTDATRDTASGTASDPQGPATSGSLFSEVLVPLSDGGTIDFSGQGYARAAANDTGAGAVAVDGSFFNGSPTLNSLTGLSTLTSDVTNNTGGVVPFTYDFFLPGPRLTLADFAGLSETDDPTIRAFFDFRVSLDFGSGFLPYVVSQGELKGGLVSHTLGTAGTDPLGSTFFTDGNYPNSIFGYQFDNLGSSVTGFLADGETVAVKTSLFVSLTAPGFETGGAAWIGDPLDLSAGAFSGNLSIVPVPAAVWLFASGLIGLAGLARRKA